VGSYHELNDLAKTYADINKQNVEVAKSDAIFAKARIDVADSLGFGVKASAEMRLQYNQKLQSQLNEQKQSYAGIAADSKKQKRSGG